jgi:PAS domain S-box-containing protein
MKVELTFLDSLGAIAVVLDLQGSILNWTHGFLELTGQLPYELSGRPLWDLASPNDRDGLRRVLIDTVNDRKSLRVDAVMTVRSGERRIAWSCSLVSGAGGDSIVVWGIDVAATVGPSGSVAMSEVQGKLAAREQELSAIYENVPGILFYIAVEPDGDFRFLSMSRAGLAATGEQFVGSLVRDVIPQRSRDMVLNHYREAIRSGKTVQWEEVSVYPAGERYGEVAVTPLYNVSGVATHLVGIVHDITERKHSEDMLERRVRDRTAELQIRNTQLRRLASDLILAEQRVRETVAKTLHDHFQQLLFSASVTLDRAVMRNPAGDQGALVQEARTYLHEALEASRTLSVDLFSPRLHDSGLPAALEWLAKRTEQQYRVAVNVSVDAKANPEAKDVRTLVFESVRELLFNAVKHAQVDQVDINLALGPGRTIVVRVTDHGVGFDPATVLHQENHVGLGLFSIQERLALLGGRLDIQSAPGKGAQFSLTIPRRDLRPSPTIASPISEVVGRERPALRDLTRGAVKAVRILIADDHPVVRAGLRELLSERPGLQVVGEAANGIEAISQAVALHPDVIIMDVSMPQMDGIEATRQIHGNLPNIRIVGLSTYDDDNVECSMREAGAAAYFNKTEGSDRLLEYLRSFRARAKRSVS